MQTAWDFHVKFGQGARTVRDNVNLGPAVWGLTATYNHRSASPSTPKTQVVRVLCCMMLTHIYLEEDGAPNRQENCAGVSNLEVCPESLVIIALADLICTRDGVRTKEHF